MPLFRDNIRSFSREILQGFDSDSDVSRQRNRTSLETTQQKKTGNNNSKISFAAIPNNDVYDLWLHPFTRKKTYCIAKPYRMQGLPTEGDGQVYIHKTS